MIPSLWVLLHLPAAHGWFWGQDDVTGALLHSYITEVIYMRQPQGFDDGSGWVCCLMQSLHGLWQAACCWNKLLHHELTKIGYHQMYSDNPVCVYLSANDDVIILAMWTMYWVFVTPKQASNSGENNSTLLSRWRRKTLAGSWVFNSLIIGPNVPHLSITGNI